MKLFHNPASPFVRKVRVALLETGLADHVELVDVVGHPTDPGSLPVQQNPLGKIPALERGDGVTLYDSRVITQFLSDMAGGTLYPTKPRYWETLTLEATADGIMDAAVLMVYETRSRAEGKTDPDWVDAMWAKVTRSLDALEHRWMSHLKGPLDMGQVAVGCALGYLDFRHADRDWRGMRPSLAGWEAEFAARPAMVETAPG